MKAGNAVLDLLRRFCSQEVDFSLMRTSAGSQVEKESLCGAGDRALPLPGRDDSAHKGTGVEPRLKDEEAGCVPGGPPRLNFHMIL